MGTFSQLQKNVIVVVGCLNSALFVFKRQFVVVSKKLFCIYCGECSISCFFGPFDVSVLLSDETKLIITKVTCKARVLYLNLNHGKTAVRYSTSLLYLSTATRVTQQPSLSVCIYPRPLKIRSSTYLYQYLSIAFQGGPWQRPTDFKNSLFMILNHFFEDL
jgi:hypothetical protein